MKKIRIGVIGVGRFGRVHLNVWNQLPECEVVAISDINEKLLAEVSSEMNISQSFVDAEKLISHGKVDAVDIVGDEDTHGRHAISSLNHNKHVFIEKPIATQLNEAEEIHALAEARNRIVMVGNISRFSQPYVNIKRAVDTGKLGNLGMIQTKRHFSRAWFDHFGKRVHPVFESGIHDLDLILWYANSHCKTVFAVEHNLSGYPHPDLFTATLTFESGLVATLHSAWLVPDGGPQNLVETLELGGTIDADIELVGQKGTARFRLAHSGLSIWSEDGVQQPELTLWPTEHSGVGGAIRSELNHFLTCVKEEKPSQIAPAKDSVDALRIADAIVRSCKNGMPVSLN